MAGLALLLSTGAIIIQLKSKPLGQGIEKYSFATPLESYKAGLQITVNKDFLAQIQLQAAISDRKIKEKLGTIKVHKTREHEGKTLLFIEYNEAGVPKREVVGMEKDAASGFWHEVYISTYTVEKTNPLIAAEIKTWPDSK